jgi:CRP-like cAMP-binding protein
MKKEEEILSCESCFNEMDSLFHYLTPEETEQLFLRSTPRRFKKGETLYHEGRRINGVYCIETGIVKIFKTGFDGKEQILMFARRGDIIGYRSVLANELACTTAKMIEDGLLCFIPADLLLDFVKNNTSFSYEIMKMACKELGSANQYITDLAQKSVRERLAEILLHLADKFGINEDNLLNIILTREELANIVGTATESVIRLLSEFKHSGLIELQGRKIRILDKEGLKHISNAF